MSKVRMTLAVGDYDRVRPLWDGSVKVEGIDLNVVLLPAEEVFFRQVRSQEFDVSEMSMSSYFISKQRRQPDMVAIPAFLSRKFRHGDIYVNKESRIKTPADLKGGRIGCPEYQMTGPVWMRGILEEHYGVAATDVHWLTGGTERPGREERLRITLPSKFNVTPIPADTTLFAMLKSGKIDAIMTARVPSPFVKGEPWIARLFPDYRQVETEYFKATGIFPIMHAVAFRKDVYERFPWAAQNLFKALCEAKDLCLRRHLNNAALTVTTPWWGEVLESTFDLMGPDFWSYGLKANEKTISTLLGYMGKQGLLPDDWHPGFRELFAPNTLEQFGV